MDRFVAMIWDQDDPSRQGQVFAWSETLQRQSPKWKCVLDGPGLRVFSYHHRGDGPVVTRWKSDNGIVIGVLFERGAEKKGRVFSLDRHEADHAMSTRGDSLIKNYWGNYLVLWRNEATRLTTVLRDPCAAVPCFMTRQHGIELLFAHAEDVAAFPGLSFTIDWTFLQSFLLHEYFVTKHTGLQGVAELLPGERVELEPNGKTTLSWAWSGAEIAARPDFQSFEEARQELRETMETCFTAWGKEYRRPLVTLSGGLDSSIVVNLLRRVSSAEIKALHYVGFGYEEYEVKLARLAAARAGVELIEVKVDLSKEDVRGVIEAPRLARPATETVAVLADELTASVADQVGADSLMTGQAGDTLFLQRGIAQHVPSDYLRLRGLGGELGRVAYSAAMLQQKPMREIIGDALSNRPWRAYAFLNDPAATKGRVLAADTERAIPETYMRHPWMAEAMRLPPGKARHLRSISALSKFHPVRGHGLSYDVVSTFLCQPVVEFVLRTPTYIFCDGGLDRALQRRAFADVIPDEIARRTGKGSISISVWQGVRANLNFFRSLVLNGALARAGWLDLAKVERMLSADGVTRGEAIFSIYQLVAAEAWLRTWRLDGARAAA